MVRQLLTICLAIAAFAFFGAPPAHGDDLFTYQVNSDTYTWVLPASPTPDGYGIGQIFSILNVSYTIDNTEYTGGQVNFYNGPNDGGGFVLEEGGGTVLLNTMGPQLYMGSEDAPTFYLNDFSLSDYGSPNGPFYTLTIETAPGTAPTPEPSSLLLLAGGLLSFIGLAWKRRLAAHSIS